uniref:Pentatricopeptide repeat-containing protein n=1 Tax=Oryza glumipatula TaxID=40148 RepID=A0A0D9ZHK9_9ORYZ
MQPRECLSRQLGELHAHFLRRGHPFPPAAHPDPDLDRAYISAIRAATAPHLALAAFACLRRVGLPAPGLRALPSLLRAIALARSPGTAGAAHGLAFRVGAEVDGFVGTALVRAYAACRRVEDARRVFDGMPDRDLVAWGVMLDCYCQARNYEEALLLFHSMKRSRVVPDQVIIATVLSTCAHTRNLRFGKAIHSYMLVSDTLIDAQVSCALINMYASCADMEMAEKLYNRVSEKDIVLSTTMVYGYAKNGKVEIAHSIFNGMPEKDVVSWSAMIAGYAESSKPLEALNLFHDMQRSGVKPDEITMMSVISACANVGALDKARCIHSFVENHRLCKILPIGNALIDMFSKCGSFTLALDVFNAMPQKNVVTWTSMITASAMHGDGRSALTLFENMKSEGIQPNGVTFLGLLYACCHAGLVEEGRLLFKIMVQQYRIEPMHEHYGCMVDLLGRAKLLGHAADLIQSMHLRPNVVIWGSLLAACRMHGDLELGAFAAKKILELDPIHGGAQVLLSNIYAEYGNWNDVKEGLSKKDYEKKKELAASEITKKLEKKLSQMYSQDAESSTALQLSPQLHEYKASATAAQPAGGQPPGLCSSVAIPKGTMEPGCN